MKTVNFIKEGFLIADIKINFDDSLYDAKEDVFAKVYKRIRGIVVKKPTKITAKRWIKNELLKKSKAGGVYKGRIKTTSQKFRQKQLDVTDTGSIK